jgi:pimeloyl-ACP methyl ester carboxylesterase
MILELEPAMSLDPSPTTRRRRAVPGTSGARSIKPGEQPIRPRRERADDRSVLLPVQRRMQDLVPGAARVTLDAGHAPHVGQPARLAEVLVPFLKG